MALVNDVGESTTANECPACLPVNDSTAAGWSGALGDEIQCELPRNHKGSHRYLVEWEDNERSYGWEKRSAAFKVGPDV